MEDEIIMVCTDCHSEVREIGYGDEGWSVCQGCGNIEQDKEEWTLERWEEEGNW